MNLKTINESWFSDSSQKQKALWTIIALGALLRIYIVFFTALPHIHKDTYEYYKQADTILSGGYTNFFPNGYPFIIALAKLLSASNYNLLLLWLNILLSTCMIYFVYYIAEKVFHHVLIGLIAAAILAVLPSQINYVRWIMTEVPSAFFLLAGYYFYYRKQNWWSGVFFGCATAVRTNIAPVFILLILLELIYYKKINLRLVFGVMVPLFFVGYYCYLKTGTFSIAGNNQVNILIAVKSSGSFVDFNAQNEYPEINTTGKAVHMYVQHLAENPGYFLKQKMANYWELWGFYASPGDGGRGVGSRLLLGIGNFFLIVFGLCGWWMNRKSFNAIILIIPFFVVTLLHVLLFALSRYTYPVEPFMVVPAAWSLHRILNRQKKNRVETVKTQTRQL